MKEPVQRTFWADTITSLVLLRVNIGGNIYSLHPLFPGSNEVDQIAKIHDIMGTPEPTVLNKFKK